MSPGRGCRVRTGPSSEGLSRLRRAVHAAASRSAPEGRPGHGFPSRSLVGQALTCPPGGRCATFTRRVGPRDVGAPGGLATSCPSCIAVRGPFPRYPLSGSLQSICGSPACEGEAGRTGGGHARQQTPRGPAVVSHCAWLPRGHILTGGGRMVVGAAQGSSLGEAGWELSQSRASVGMGAPYSMPCAWWRGSAGNTHQGPSLLCACPAVGRLGSDVQIPGHLPARPHTAALGTCLPVAGTPSRAGTHTPMAETQTPVAGTHLLCASAGSRHMACWMVCLQSLVLQGSLHPFAGTWIHTLRDQGAPGQLWAGRMHGGRTG